VIDKKMNPRKAAKMATDAKINQVWQLVAKLLCYLPSHFAGRRMAG